MKGFCASERIKRGFRHGLVGLLLSLLFASPVLATAYVGSTLGYEHVSGNALRVHHRAYLLCDGSAVLPPTNVVAVGIGTSCTQPVASAWIQENVQEVTALAPSIPTTCTTPGAAISGVRLIHFSRILDFTGVTCNKYKLQWSQCCRNSASLNIQNPGFQGIGTQTDTIRIPLTPGNNSPRFRQAPPYLINPDRNNLFDMRAEDPDGDSLGYKMVQPLDHNFDTIPYAPTFNLSNPMGATWNAGIDQSGRLYFTPGVSPVVMRAALAIQVTEYRNGQPIGSVRLDFEVEVNPNLPGPNAAPTLQGPYNVVGFKSYFGAFILPRGGTGCFDLQAIDPDAGQQTTMAMFTRPPSATFTDTLGGNPDTLTALAPIGRTCWTAPDSFAIHDFTFLAIDPSLQLNNMTTRSFIVWVGDTASVWPGDADNDQVANVFDLLGIGLAHGETHIDRVLPSISWTPQECVPWQDTIIGGTDYKYCDTDGNGTVQDSDTLAIHNNYGLVHLKSFEPVARGAATDPPFKLVLPPTADVGDTIHAEIHLGDGNIQANDVYGYAVSVVYNPALIDTSTIWVDFSNSWLGNSSNSLMMQHHFHALGQVDASQVRTTHTTVSGQGEICRIHFVIIDNIDGKRLLLDSAQFDMDFIATRVIGLDAEIPIDVQSDSMMLYDRTDGLDATPQEAGLSVFPNPARDWVWVESKAGALQQVRVHDTQGRLVLETMGPTETQKIRINTTRLNKGLYLLQAQIPNGQWLTRKLVVE